MHQAMPVTASHTGLTGKVSDTSWSGKTTKLLPYFISVLSVSLTSTRRDNGRYDIPDDIHFTSQRIVPRMLVDTNARDTSTELFGHKISAPICFAPVGINVRRLRDPLER